MFQKRNIWHKSAYKHAGMIIKEKNLGKLISIELSKTKNTRLGGMREIEIN